MKGANRENQMSAVLLKDRMEFFKHKKVVQIFRCMSNK